MTTNLQREIKEFRNRFQQQGVIKDTSGKIRNYLFTDEFEAFLTSSLTRIQIQERKKLLKIIDSFKCDFNWDFEKGKRKHKSYVSIFELEKRLRDKLELVEK